MFKKILVANRSEIALRLARACREMEIPSVAVFSEADRESLHVRAMDEAYSIGAPPSTESYLNITKIIETALRAGADAIHPGYGFLAENPEFVKACGRNGITFIGPSAAPMSVMGNKILARKAMEEAGVPVVPGVTGEIKDLRKASAIAEEIGYPVMLKAACGGGGKGMRIVNSSSELETAISQASGEALSAFGDGSLYFEKLLVNPRHIEIQILADKFGNIVHLGERECSIQRRHQKLIEESPSPIVDDDFRKKMGEAAVAAARATGYNSVGTVEFLVDDERNFFFLEMNTRLQVEHPVTEMVTGVDIVKEQIRIAADKPLSLKQEHVEVRGAAIECRICTEDPYNNFYPSAGTVYRVIEPGGPGVRLDSSCFPSGEVSLYYDSLIAKLITWGSDRNEAIMRMRRALSEYRILGIKTNIPFHQHVLRDPLFIDGNFNTGYVSEHYRPAAGPELAELISVITASILENDQQKFRLDRISESQSTDRASAWKTSGRPVRHRFG